MEVVWWVLIPPLVDVSLVVELSALVVEAVSDFVSYHHSDPTEVQRFGEVLVVKRGLKDSRHAHWCNFTFFLHFEGGLTKLQRTPTKFFPLQKKGVPKGLLIYSMPGRPFPYHERGNRRIKLVTRLEESRRETWSGFGSENSRRSRRQGLLSTGS